MLVVLQAEHCSTSHICTLDEYMTACRDIIGTDPSFGLVQDLPHDVMWPLGIVSLARDTTEMLIIGNVSTSFPYDTDSTNAKTQ
jgi:hypothetical protein